jgi:hypothetical protein
MARPLIQVIGVHYIKMSQCLVDKAVGLKLGVGELSPLQREATIAQVRAELQHVAMIEVVVSSRDDGFRMEDLGQHGSDQAPYDEVFLSLDGSRVIAEGFEVPPGPDLRVAFWLHFFKPDECLRTSYGDALLPRPTPMPERLGSLVKYSPVD